MAGQPTQMQPTLPQSAHKNAFRALGGQITHHRISSPIMTMHLRARNESIEDRGLTIMILLVE